MPHLGLHVLFQDHNVLRLLEGLGVTIGVALIAMVISVIVGVLFGFVMVSPSPIIRILSRLYLEIIRIVPQLVLLFVVYFGLARTFNINLSGSLSAIIVFSLWGIAEMGELVRGALTTIPKHQFDSGLAIGLTKAQLYRYVIFPQMLRQLIPQAVNLLTRMIKTTSLIVLIGVVEVVKIGQQIIEVHRLQHPSSAIWIYGFIFCLYFAVCYPISRFSVYLERLWEK